MRTLSYVLAGGLFALLSYLAIQHACHEGPVIDWKKEARVASLEGKSPKATASIPAAEAPAYAGGVRLVEPDAVIMGKPDAAMKADGGTKSRIAAAPAIPPPPAAPLSAKLPKIELSLHRELVPLKVREEVASSNQPSEPPVAEPTEEEEAAPAPAPMAAPTEARSEPMPAAAPAAAPSRPMPVPQEDPSETKTAAKGLGSNEEEGATGYAYTAVNEKALIVTFPAQPCATLAELAGRLSPLTLRSEGQLLVAGKTLAPGTYLLRLRPLEKGKWGFVVGQGEGERAVLPLQLVPQLNNRTGGFMGRLLSKKAKETKLRVSLYSEAAGKVVMYIQLGEEAYTAAMELH